MAEHTPGPWYVVGEAGDCLIISTIKDPALANEMLNRDVSTAVVSSSEWTDVSAEDARLIAAAPELLAAGQALVERWDTPNWKDAKHTGESINKLRAAIAKATGDGDASR